MTCLFDISSFFLFRPIDNDQVEVLRNLHGYRSNQTNDYKIFPWYLKNLLIPELRDSKVNNDPMSFKWHRDSVLKGDPREFIG